LNDLMQLEKNVERHKASTDEVKAAIRATALGNRR